MDTDTTFIEIPIEHLHESPFNPRTAVELLWMAECCFNGVEWDDREALAKRHGFKDGDELEKVLGQWPADRLALFAVECMLVGEANVDAYNVDHPRSGERLFLSAKHYGVDAEAIRAELSPGAPTPSPAARAPKEAKKPKARAGAKKGKAAAAAPDDLLASAAGQEQTDDAGSAGGSAATVDGKAEEVEA